MMSPLDHSPTFSVTAAQEIAETKFGIKGTATELPSERDQTFRITTENYGIHVLKIANAQEDKAFLVCQNKAMMHIIEKRCEDYRHVTCCPQVRRALNGEAIILVTGERDQSHFTRLLSWVPGKPMAEVKPHNKRFLENLGVFFGHLDLALADFDHPAAHRDFYWDLKIATRIIHQKIQHIPDKNKRDWVASFLSRYETHVVGRLGDLRTGIIHNDGNDYNVMVSTGDRWSMRIEGVIDFGDMVHTHVINELAILCAYAMMNKVDPLNAARRIISGYHQIHPITEEEAEVLFDLICIRLCVSVCNAAEQSQQDPDNAYLSISERPAWHLLSVLRHIHPRFAGYMFRDACNMAPVSASINIAQWLARHSSIFSSITGKPLTPENYIVFDLSVRSPMISAGPEIKNPALLTERLFSKMKNAGATVGIGRYNEPRIGYVSDQFNETCDELPRRRTIHLGLDLFMAQGSPVHAVYDGVVHSVANNAMALDYGPTIILSHESDEGHRFYTLYGHLSLDSLENIKPGMQIPAGQPFAHIGSSKVNGGSPPHVHFQVITDMLGNDGNFPGVARAGYQRVWNSISPNPGGILGLAEPRVSCQKIENTEILKVRRNHLGKSLSISYGKPLNIVRGVAQYLYSDTGQAYLDCINNVCHVGHCHPHIVAAGQQQMAVLNTNTRYLHDNITRYAERLLAKFPEPLSVCFFVCTGSEANELALRMARTYTKAEDIIMLDGAYHGNTQGLIDISPYKHDGPGGKGAPTWAHKVPMPCGYRGPHKGTDAETGERYAGYVGEVVAQITAQGTRPAAFICESILGCGGQVILPDNYMASAFKKVRAAGGLCIADEVQVGFGRVGSHFWAFETQGVVPDIVTLGKPIGNGHPLAVVVTTPEIATTFNNGMEYFNTFGGNPVSCAIGMAVLDVIENERLQKNAFVTGNYLLEKLKPLSKRYPLVGDVRGLGLYAGVELVTDRNTLEPAANHANYIINRMCDHGILMSTDGPLHNILKFKPPIVFARENVDTVVAVLEKVLQEDCLQV